MAFEPFEAPELEAFEAMASHSTPIKGACPLFNPHFIGIEQQQLNRST